MGRGYDDWMGKLPQALGFRREGQGMGAVRGGGGWTPCLPSTSAVPHLQPPAPDAQVYRDFLLLCPLNGEER